MRVFGMLVCGTTDAEQQLQCLGEVNRRQRHGCQCVMRDVDEAYAHAPKLR
jgi:hypothetical protein